MRGGMRRSEMRVQVLMPARSVIGRRGSEGPRIDDELGRNTGGNHLVAHQSLGEKPGTDVGIAPGVICTQKIEGSLHQLCNRPPALDAGKARGCDEAFHVLLEAEAVELLTVDRK